MTNEIDIVVKAQDKASKPLNQVNDSLKGLGTSATQAQKPISAMGIALGTFGGAMIMRGVDAIVKLGTNVVMTGIQFDNMKQQATIAFTT
ncbi:MAG: hypothetical protein ACHQX3_05150, partial [Nitrospirales bacterium]